MQQNWNLDLFTNLSSTSSTRSGSSSGYGADISWLYQVLQIRGLRDIRIRRAKECCPVPREGMEFWVAFWKSVELETGGVEEWIRGVCCVRDGEER